MGLPRLAVGRARNAFYEESTYMRKAFRHSGVLMMVAVVALGMLGAAYTLWFEDLQLNTQVNTGTFDADVSIHPWNGSGYGNEQTAEGAYDNAGQPVVAIISEPRLGSRSAFNLADTPPQSSPPIPDAAGYARYSKANFTVGSVTKPMPDCDAAIGSYGSSPANTNDVAESNRLDLTMTGLFPYAGCEYEIDIHNSGSVPMHVSLLAGGLYQRCNADGTGCVDITTSYPALSFIGDPSNASCAALFGVGRSTDPNSLGQLQVGGVPVQLHQGESLVCRVKIILDQAADGENRRYKAQINWRAYQWNEVPGLAPNQAQPEFFDSIVDPAFPGHTLLP
jgi:hypothetical protein